MLQQDPQILDQCRGHQLVHALHVCQDETVVLPDDGKGPLDTLVQFLVLHNVAVNNPHIFLVRHADLNVDSRLGGASQQLWALLHAKRWALVIDVLPQISQSLHEDTIARVLLLRLIVANSSQGYDEQQDQEENAQDHQLIFILQQKSRQSDTQLHLYRAIRVAILFKIGPRHIVSERRIRLGDLNEFGLCQRIVWIQIRVELLGHLAIRFLDEAFLASKRNFQDCVRIKSLHIHLGIGHGAPQNENQHPQNTEDPTPNHLAVANARLHRRLLLRLCDVFLGS
mmetsp:Transcript_14526/g.35185  ORF Transcript_14526/g.35185 Transcript_14526/m.35185 type:complete len:283 (-) Transcript_14526:179-1027(-)